MRPARAVLAAILVPLALPTAAAEPWPERVGGWTVAAAPPTSHDCSMVIGGAHGRLLIVLMGDTLRMEVTSKDWSFRGSTTYPTHLTIDADKPLDIAPEGLWSNVLQLTSDMKLHATTFVERLKTGRSLVIRKEGGPGPDAVTFDVSDFGAAYARLQACVAGAGARASAATIVWHERCDKLADAVATSVGLTRGAMDANDQITISGPEEEITVLCGATDEKPGIDLSRDGRGIPPGILTMASKLAGVLAGRPTTTFAALPTACLARVRRYELRRGGKRTHFPEGTTVLFEGQVKAPPVSMTCRYYDATKVKPSFVLATE